MGIARGSEDGDQCADEWGSRMPVMDGRLQRDFSRNVAAVVPVGSRTRIPVKGALPAASESSVFPNRCQGRAKSIHVILCGFGTLGPAGRNRRLGAPQEGITRGSDQRAEAITSTISCRSHTLND